MRRGTWSRKICLKIDAFLALDAELTCLALDDVLAVDALLALQSMLAWEAVLSVATPSPSVSRGWIVAEFFEEESATK